MKLIYNCLNFCLASHQGVVLVHAVLLQDAAHLLVVPQGAARVHAVLVHAALLQNAAHLLVVPPGAARVHAVLLHRVDVGGCHFKLPFL